MSEAEVREMQRKFFMEEQRKLRERERVRKYRITLTDFFSNCSHVHHDQHYYTYVYICFKELAEQEQLRREALEKEEQLRQKKIEEDEKKLESEKLTQGVDTTQENDEVIQKTHSKQQEGEFHPANLITGHKVVIPVRLDQFSSYSMEVFV